MTIRHTAMRDQQNTPQLHTMQHNKQLASGNSTTALNAPMPAHACQTLDNRGMTTTLAAAQNSTCKPHAAEYKAQLQVLTPCLVRLPAAGLRLPP
jgi:hypothetical protein